MIEKYEFGRIVIDGKAYTDDVRIIDGKVLPKWWRKEGHFLDTGDLEEVFAYSVKILIVGTGHSGLMKVGESVRKYCKEHDIELIEMITAEAVSKYNEISKKGKGVAGAFHLTC